jgi:hypothetical protein
LGGSNFNLHCCKYSTSYMTLLFGAGLSSIKKHGKWKFAFILFDIPYI